MIPWQPWSEAALAQAVAENKPIALHIGATWCHWCHVMDEGSYTWPGVAELLAARFVCVRVDTDHRPDVNERYNQGGWPTFAILDAKGEVLTGRTYVPGIELLSLLRGASDPGSRWTVAAEPAPVPQASGLTVEQVRARVEEAYDPYHGGFGELTKFPHPTVLEFVGECAARGDAWASGALAKTLAAMTDNGMYDHEAGGFFRYATQDDWNAPHYEKLLEDHGRLLSVYARFGTVPVSALAWLFQTLYDPGNGVFAGSQDADEAYYSQSLASRGTPPTVDRTVYAGWNGLIATALVRAGGRLGRPGLISVATRTMQALSGLVHEGRVTRHVGGVSGLLEDQVQVADGWCAVAAASGDPVHVAAALVVAEWCWRNLQAPEGGLWDRVPGIEGRLRHVRRSVHGNAAYSRVCLQLQALTGTSVWYERALACATVALGEGEDWGFMAAPAASALARVRAPRVVIKVGTLGWPVPPMLLHGLAEPHPDRCWIGVREGVPVGMAMICTSTACLRPLGSLAAVNEALAKL